jgi:tetratricopeptide (TPR) repeat protein
MTAPMQNPQTTQWQLFALTSKKESEVKPFDRVSVLVKQDYVQEKGEFIPPDAVLAVYDGDKKVTEADVIQLRKEIPERYQRRYTRKALVSDYLTLWEVSYLEAEAIGLLSNIKSAAALKLETEEFWAQVYKDSILKDTYGLDISELKSALEKNKEYFFEKIDSNAVYYDGMNSDIATFLSINPKEFELEYHLFPDKYMKDSLVQPFSEVKYQIFQNIKRNYNKRPWEQMIAKLWSKYNVQVLDPFYQKENPTDPVEVFKLAQNLHTDRKLNEALKQYKIIRSVFNGPEYKSLQDSVCMAIAQVYVEQEKFPEALSEYRRLLYYYPESPNNYKAQFMIGFIYSENMKKENLAIRAFKKLLEKYPDCDLADDADWMIRNIESGGALMPTLEDS